MAVRKRKLMGGSKKPIRVLVVTDRFPPETLGGAELSLHDALLPLCQQEWDCRVVALSESDDLNSIADRGPLYVLRVWDGQNSWPPGRQKLDLMLRRIPRPLLKLIGPLLRQVLFAKHVFSRKKGLANRFRRLIAHKLKIHGKIVGNVEERILYSGAIEFVQSLINDWHPHIVHCDNLNSMIIGADLDLQGAKLVGNIRDNRFLCMRSDQRTIVGETGCTKCEFGCINEKQPLKSLVLAELRHVRAQRQSVLEKPNVILTTSQYLSSQITSISRRLPPPVILNPHPEILAESELLDSGCKPSVLFAGNITLAKGAHVLADCIEDFAHAVPLVQVVFAGRGNLREELEERARRSAIPDQIHFTGFVDRQELYRVMARTAVIVAPALWPEPFGRLPLEAGIVGRPIVASRIGGYIETIRHEETGILVPPGDREAFFQAVINLLMEPERANEMGRAARSHVQKSFSPSNVSKRLANEWRKTLE